MSDFFQRFGFIEEEKLYGPGRSLKVNEFAETTFGDLQKMKFSVFTLDQIQPLHFNMSKTSMGLLAAHGAQSLVPPESFCHYPPQQTIRNECRSFIFYFVHFLRCISVVSANMFEPTVPISVHACVLLVPLLEFFKDDWEDAYVATIGYQGKEAIPTNIHDFVRVNADCHSPKTEPWIRSCAVWLSQEMTPHYNKPDFGKSANISKYIKTIVRPGIDPKAKKVRELLGSAVIRTIIMLTEPEKTLTSNGMLRRMWDWFPGFDDDEVKVITKKLREIKREITENRYVPKKYKLDLNNLASYRSELVAVKLRVDQTPRSPTQFEAEAMLNTALLRLAKLEVGKMLFDSIVNKNKTAMQIITIPANTSNAIPNFIQLAIIHKPIPIHPLMTPNFVLPYLQPSSSSHPTAPHSAQGNHTTPAVLHTQLTNIQVNNSQNNEPPMKRPRLSAFHSAHLQPSPRTTQANVTLLSLPNLAFTIPQEPFTPFAISDILSATRNLVVEGNMYNVPPNGLASSWLSHCYQNSSFT